MSDFLFSVIIPTYNRVEQLEQCLDAVSKMDFPHGKFEVVVVDDGGSVVLENLIASYVGRLFISLVRQENRGPAHARNTGVSRAKGNFLAFIDDDCCPHKDWLSFLYNKLKENPTALIGGSTENALLDNIFSEASQELIHYLYEYYNSNPTRSQFFTSNNMALSKEAFLQLGGFDVTTLKATAEDREICDRFLFHEKELFFVKEARVFHFHKLNLLGLIRQHFNYGKGAYYFRKVRALRGQQRLKVEPLSFYSSLIYYPIKKNKRKSLRLSFLLIFIQVINVMGFAWESLLRTLQGDNIKAKA